MHQSFFTDHCGLTHHVIGNTGGQQGDGMAMGRYSLSQHPICGAGWLLPMIRTFTPLFMLPCRRWSRFANGEDAKLRFNLSKVKIYILGISRERARELVRQNIERDPSLRVFANSTIWTLRLT